MISLTTLEFVFAIISVFVSGIMIGVSIITVIETIKGLRKRK